MQIYWKAFRNGWFARQRLLTESWPRVKLKNFRKNKDYGIKLKLQYRKLGSTPRGFSHLFGVKNGRKRGNFIEKKKDYD